MLKVWLYGFGVNVRTTRKLEQRIREDLASAIWRVERRRTTRH